MHVRQCPKRIIGGYRKIAVGRISRSKTLSSAAIRLSAFRARPCSSTSPGAMPPGPPRPGPTSPANSRSPRRPPPARANCRALLAGSDCLPDCPNCAVDHSQGRQQHQHVGLHEFSQHRPLARGVCGQQGVKFLFAKDALETRPVRPEQCPCASQTELHQVGKVVNSRFLQGDHGQPRVGADIAAEKQQHGKDGGAIHGDAALNNSICPQPGRREEDVSQVLPGLGQTFVRLRTAPCCPCSAPQRSRGRSEPAIVS